MRLRLPSATTLFLACVVLILLWLIVIPLGQMVLNSFRTGHPAAPGPFTLKNYLVAYTSPLTYRMIFNTLVFAVGGTAITTVIAIFFAWLLERTDMPLQNLCWSLLLIPLAMPGLLFSMAYVFLLLPKSGLLNVFLRDALSHLGVELSEGPINIYSLGGMIFLDGLRGVTTVFLMIVGAFRIMDPAMEEASFAAGAKNWMTLKKVTLPVLRPALLAAVLYEFASSMESFEAPLVLGLPGRVYVYSTMIYISTRDAIPNYGLGAAFAASYFVLSLGLVYLYQRATVRQSERFATVTGRGYRPHRIRLGRWRYPALALFILYFLFAVALPLGVLVWTSLLPSYQPPSRAALTRLHWGNYQMIFADPAILRAIWNTLIMTFGAATATVALAFGVSWLVVRARVRGSMALDGLTFASHAIPGVVIALSFIFLYLQPPMRSLGLYGTVWVVVLALVTQYVSFASRATNAAVMQVHTELEEAGEVSGASRLRILWQITFPLIRPAFIAAWIWVAAHAVRAFSVPLMLAGRDSRPLAVMLWHLWDEEQNLPAAAALGVLLILALTLLTFSGRAIVTRGFASS
ncbi:MAG TPA: iron ABC transporter permease [Candidatus Binatia bacterium]|jgi:iron(III) transport system permease protein